MNVAVIGGVPIVSVPLAAFSKPVLTVSPCAGWLSAIKLKTVTKEKTALERNKLVNMLVTPHCLAPGCQTLVQVGTVGGINGSHAGIYGVECSKGATGVDDIDAFFIVNLGTAKDVGDPFAVEFRHLFE